MEILLHRSIETVKFSLKSVNLCKFTVWCTDVLADKPHSQFYMKVLSKKVRHIRWCLRYLFLKSGIPSQSLSTYSQSSSNKLLNFQKPGPLGCLRLSDFKCSVMAE